MRSLLFSPSFSWWVVLLLGALTLCVIWWSARKGVLHPGRRRALVGMRIAALGLLLLLLAQPQRRVDEVTVIKPQLAVLIDGSESMEDKADPRQTLRADRVREWLASPALAAARENYEVRFFQFDFKLAELPPDLKGLHFSGPGSNVIAAVQQCRERFTGQPLAGIVLLSDGLDSSGVGAGFKLPSGVPVHTIELEKLFEIPDKPRRSWISAVDPPGRLVIGWDAEIRASISANGLAGKTVSVELWKDGIKSAETSVTFNEDEQTRPVIFPVSATAPGVMQFELRLSDPSADPEARVRHFAVEAVAPGKRILYVQNSFGFEFKFLRRAVAGDRNLQLQAFVRSGDGRMVAMGDSIAGAGRASKLEFSQAGLASYAVVVLGDLPPETLTPEHYQALRDFVDRGGGLVLLGGGSGLASSDFAKTALAEASPLKLPADYKEGRFSVRITDEGLRHPVFGPLFANVKEFPPLLSVNVSRSPAPAAEVLIEAEDTGGRIPVVAATRFGKGRVVTIMTDTVWHWRMGAKTWSADKSPYDVFWGQLMEWLVPKEQDKQGTAKLEVVTERPTYLIGEQPEVRAVLEVGVKDGKPPASLQISLRAPDGKTFEYQMRPGQFPAAGGKLISGYVAPVEPNVPGLFTAQVRWSAGEVKLEAETRFSVSKPASERTGSPINRALLEGLSQQSEGRFLPWEQRDEWQKLVRVKEQQIARVRLVDVWNHPVLLVLLLSALAGDWVLRKRWNLP